MKILTVDDHQRVRLPDKLEPRTRLSYERIGNQIVLTPVAPVQTRAAKVRFEKRNGRTVGVIEGAKFNESALKQALSEFP
jgi:hypothetical protein